MANFDAREWEWKGEKYKVERGQFITSASSIIENCGQGITRQNVRTALKRFEKLEFLTYESTKKGMLITIVNWGLYQGNCDEPNQEPNQWVTKTQPRGNQGVTTKEERKKDKNDTNIYSAFFEEMWSLYPSKKGKGRISNTKKKEIYKLGDEFKRCISRYIEDVEARRRNGFPELKYQNGSTFFNSGYEDYLDKNYQEKEPPPVRVLKPIYKKARGVDDD